MFHWLPVALLKTGLCSCLDLPIGTSQPSSPRGLHFVCCTRDKLKVLRYSALETHPLSHTTCDSIMGFDDG